MPKFRPFSLLKQVAAVPFHFLQHQWKGTTARTLPEKHTFGKHRRQYLMFWMPPKSVPIQHSVVVFYHGGGWRLGWPDQFPTVADWFLARGYPVIMPAYRLLPWYNFRDMREDLNLSLAKILELLRVKGLEDKKLLIAGMSAGATLAAHLCFNRNELADFCMTPNYFSGFLSFGGPLDLNKLPDLPQVRRFAGGPFNSNAFQEANPMHWMSSSDHLPVLLVHGTDDAIVPFESSESFYQQYSGPKSLHSIVGGSHLDSLGFALDDLETSTVVENWMRRLQI